MTNQLSPNPDYRSDLPEGQLCGCEESEHLRAELGAAHVRNAEQAAVIERVRGEMTATRPGRSVMRMKADALKALAAAPEHTAPSTDRDLEDRLRAGKGVWERATARAEAAEHQATRALASSDEEYVLRQRAESEAAALRAEVDRLRAPIPIVLHCPECRARHIDEGEFATKVHHTHSCQWCGLTWRPAVVATVGVQFLPGFKNESPAPTEREAVDPKALTPDDLEWTGLSDYDPEGNVSELQVFELRERLARREAQRG